MGVATLVCRVDPRVLGELEDAPWALRAEAPRILLPKMDAARGSATGLDAALASIAGGLTGAGVLVAVIDSGVDWRHPDFRHGDGSSRIERFLHAFRPEGALASTYDVYSQADIDAALRAEAGPPDEAKEVPDGDPVGHGTHCAAIAAGNGRGLAGGRFRGVAPQAALMTMRSEPLYDDHTIAGISQAFELAGDRPAVVSISLGSHFGAHDGTSALEVEIDRQSGPGRIVVVAAGNEGDDAIHTQGQLAVGTDLLIPFRISDRELQFVDVWIPRGDDVDVFLETPSGTLHEPTDQDVETSEGDFHVTFVEDRVNRDQNLFIVLANGKVNDT
jgi:subtilisin family serine protease